ncbi:hypothetical protein TNCV_1518801 [Trichonephila clavipes]|nr:hypothetical protein TNCV_1518801 [Trichonephila clavipes]
MDACKYILPSWQGGTLNSRRAASLPVRYVEEERYEVPYHLQGILPQSLGGTVPKTLSPERRLIQRLPTGEHPGFCFDMTK